MECVKCGKLNEAGADSCVQCGAALHSPDGTPKQPEQAGAKKLVAGIGLVFFFAVSIYGALVGMPLWTWGVSFLLIIVWAMYMRRFRSSP